MRFAAYTGTSMLLATAVIIRALHERANFYSASVYLAQSNACLMVLTNVALLGVCTTMLGLQRLFYGQLRPIEVEQLYEKAWFAITETCLAMTIFREEVGGWFLVMFVCLLIGKVWGWIGEGRVEILEQQPPSNPRLFHTRLSISLMISTLFDMFMLQYSINTVLSHARPNMMVMFAFEFAVLTITSASTMARYTISLYEANVIKLQIRDRRKAIRREREIERAQLPTDGPTSQESAANSSAIQDDIDALDIDVPGWEEKGRWVFYLDLATDFFKLVLYLAFFFVLCMFYGMPIHIIRDVALTIRSFYKRIGDFVRYRQATRDMNERYPDATAEEVAREDVCIICREDITPWRGPTAGQDQQPANAGAAPIPPTSIDERLRPKKLPCGHILHFACLRSWLERQQNCPTCRRPVLAVTRVQQPTTANPPERAQAQPNQAQAQAQVPFNGNLHQPLVAQNVFNLGPLRIAFGARHGGQIPPQQQNPNWQNQQGVLPAGGQMPRIGNAFGFQGRAPETQTRTVASFSPTNIQVQLAQVEQQLMREINGLRLQQNQLYFVRALQGELARLRIAQSNPEVMVNGTTASSVQPRNVDTLPSISQVGNVFGAGHQQQSLAASNPNLPPGMTLPPGWSVLPLQRLPDHGDSSPEISVQADSTTVPLAQPASDLGERPSSSNVTMTNHSESLPGSSGIPESSSSHPSSSSVSNECAKPAQNGLSRAESPARSQNGRTASPSDQTSAKIPQWSSAAQSVKASRMNADSDDIRQSEVNIGSPQRETNGIADSKLIKGKGKASTVEESHEEMD